MKHVCINSVNNFYSNSKIKTILFMLSLLFLSSCSQNAKKYEEAISIKEKQQAPKKLFNKKNEEDFINLKIIRSADVKYKVNHVKKTTKKIKDLVNSNKGYISDMYFSNNLYQKNNRFTIKVPQEKFEIILDSIARFAIFIEYENITSKDVTEEYVDLQARLITKKEIKQRYERILRKNAKTVEEILLTEEKLRIIQEEIEAFQGKLNYLSNKVSLTTIEVNLYETVEYKEEPESYSKTFFSKIKNGFIYGWDLIEAIFIGLTYIWPLLIIGILGIVYYKRRK